MTPEAPVCPDSISVFITKQMLILTVKHGVSVRVWKRMYIQYSHPDQEFWTYHISDGDHTGKFRHLLQMQKYQFGVYRNPLRANLVAAYNLATSFADHIHSLCCSFIWSDYNLLLIHQIMAYTIQQTSENKLWTFNKHDYLHYIETVVVTNCRRSRLTASGTISVGTRWTVTILVHQRNWKIQ